MRCMKHPLNLKLHVMFYTTTLFAVDLFAVDLFAVDLLSNCLILRLTIYFELLKIEIASIFKKYVTIFTSTALQLNQSGQRERK